MDIETTEPAGYVICQHCGKKFRAITALHLRNIHGYEDEHPILEYKAQFGLRFSVCQDSRKKISEAMESFWEDRGQHWTDEDVLDAIRQIHDANGSLRPHDVPGNLHLIARRRFGTWQAAVERAGLDYEKVTGIERWSRERVIERIQQLAAAGIPLHSTYIKQHYPVLHGAAIKRFPSSWARALSAAGFDPEEHKKAREGCDKGQVENWVKSRVAEHQSILARDAPNDMLQFVYKRLGMRWTDFVESLGIPYPGVKKRRDWTAQKVLEEIRRLYTAGHRLNYHAVQDAYVALIHQARKYFGSWDGACAAAGVPCHRNSPEPTAPTAPQTPPS